MRRTPMRLLISSALIFLMPAAALAAPGLPEAFHGSVSAAVGTRIEASIAGTVLASTTVEKGSVYGYAPHLFFVPDFSGTHAHAAISFTIGGKLAAQTAEFANGAITELNLSIPGATTTATTTLSIEKTATTGIASGDTANATATARLFIPAHERHYDLNADRKVDLFDFTLLIANWGESGKGSVADINGDGTVDFHDFNLLMGHWTL